MKKLIKKPIDIFDKPLPMKSAKGQAVAAATTKAEELVSNKVITIFKADDCTWYQGFSAKEIKEQYKNDVGEELESEPVELTGRELDRLIYKPDLESGAPYKCSFREELIWRVKNGNMRTELFASSEY